MNVADPANPVILDRWVDPLKIPGILSGSAVMRVQGDYLYIGGMAEGLVILNISDPSNMSFVSKYKPDILFPHVDNEQDKVNARGMVVDDSLVYLVYDAGGIRVINCSNINSPMEIHAFANPITFPALNWPRAYNNAVLDDSLLYVAVDYCGLEVWNVSNPLNPSMITHWNPVGCPLAGLWWDAPIHTNELIHQKECNLLFVSTGKSNLMVMDVSDPLMPVAIDSFGTVLDTMATWGVDVSDDHIYLTYAYIGNWVPQLLTPFYSDWSGVKQLSYTKCNASTDELAENNDVQIYPNPAEDLVNVSVEGSNASKVYIYSLQGQKIIEESGSEFTFDTSSWSDGMYVVKIESGGEIYTEKLVVGE